VSAPDGEALVDELEQVVHQHLLRRMPVDGTGELAGMGVAHLLITYLAWIGRLIPRAPRVVHQSREMLASPKTAEHAADLEILIAKIRNGEDLRPHLSKRVATAYVPEAKAADMGNQQRADRDVLLAAWGLHHLHLSSELDTDGEWVKRGADLLIGAFDATNAYLVGIYPHGSWALKELMEIVVRNWPDAGLVLAPMSGTRLASPEPTDEERLELHNAGVTVLLEIDGVVYAPIGQTAAGTPMMVTRAVNDFMWHLRDLRQTLAGELARYQSDVEQTQHRTLSGNWNAVVIGRVAGFRCDDIFMQVATLGPDGI
jgi:hypothetical protein